MILFTLLRDGFFLIFDWIALFYDLGSELSEDGLRRSRRRMFRAAAGFAFLVILHASLLLLGNPPNKRAIWLGVSVSSFFMLGFFDLARRLGRTMREYIVTQIMKQ